MMLWPLIDLLHLTVNVSEKFLLLLEIFLGMLYNHAENSHGYRRRISTARTVIRTLIRSIMMKTPISVVTDVMSYVKTWFRLC